VIGRYGDAVVTTAPTTARRLLPLLGPAVAVGVGAALVLLGVSVVAEKLQHVLWGNLPDALGIGRYSIGWMLAVLTATGIAVGLVVWKAPGHAGPDPATTGLVDPPLAVPVLPGLLVATALALAGGVSLGPENPITAVNVALACALGKRFATPVPAEIWIMLAAAGTIGALFGTPVGAALIIGETLAARPAPGALWDKLFAPLAAAGAGSLTMVLISHPSFDINLPPFTKPGYGDILAALVIATAGAALGLVLVYALPYAHTAFRRLRNPLLMLTAGGLTLGLLGALGGKLTLFKGLDEVKTLAAHPDAYSTGRLALLTGVKLAALLVAAACGMRGGRIFPAVFVGTALGLFAHAVVPAVPPALGVTCAVLGVLLAITRQGWLSLFTAAVLVADTAVLPILCLAMLPAWLLVTGRPQMRLNEDGTPLR
jgi:H+/Cl- antiporter ClcA